MDGFRTSFINEVERMFKRKKAATIIVISLIAIILGQLVVSGVRYGFGLRTTSSTAFPILVLSVFVNTILPLFTALVAIDTFTGDFAQNTMKIALTRPVTRFKLFSAKVAAIGFFALINLAVVMVLATLTGFLFNASSSAVTGFIKIIVSYLVSLVPIMVLALVITFLANIFGSGAAAFFISIIIFLASKVLELVFPQYSSLLITSSLGWYNLWIGDILPLSKITREFFIMLGYGIMFFTAGYYLFDRREL